MPARAGAPPSLADLALENTREGCVRETFGALVALHQAEHATDAEIRGAFASIAEDEIAHAQLSWDLARWFERRLGDSHARLHAEARAELRAAAVSEYDGIDRELGVPEPEMMRALFDDLFWRIDAMV